MTIIIACGQGTLLNRMTTIDGMAEREKNQQLLLRGLESSVTKLTSVSMWSWGQCSRGSMIINNSMWEWVGQCSQIEDYQVDN